MSETTATSQSFDALVLDKKINAYGDNKDFVAPRELTVTITLAEYRALVSSDSKSRAEIDDLRSAKWKLEAENKKLKDALETLKTVCPMNTAQQEAESNDN